MSYSSNIVDLPGFPTRALDTCVPTSYHRRREPDFKDRGTGNRGIYEPIVPQYDCIVVISGALSDSVRRHVSPQVDSCVPR